MAHKKRDIADAIRAKLGISNYEAGHLTETLLKVIKDTLTSGEDILISGFGKFQISDKAERLGRNPKTGESMMLKPRRVVTFKPSGKLRDRLNNGR